MKGASDDENDIHVEFFFIFHNLTDKKKYATPKKFKYLK